MSTNNAWLADLELAAFAAKNEIHLMAESARADIDEWLCWQRAQLHATVAPFGVGLFA